MAMVGRGPPYALMTFIASVLSSKNTVTSRMRMVERDHTMPI